MRHSAIIFLFTLCCIFYCRGENVNFYGGTKEIIKETPPSSSGLNIIYVVYDISEISQISIGPIDNVAKFNVQIYSNLGGGYAQDIPFEIDGSNAVIKSPRGDMGYIVENGNSQYYFWIVDYSKWKFSISSITKSEDNDCDFTQLSVNGNGDAIKYYGINGRQIILDRDIQFNFTTLEWDNDSKAYVTVDKNISYESLSPVMTINPPLYCSTTVTVSGDRFLKEWGLIESIESETIHPNGLQIHTEAIQTNMQDSDENVGSNVIRGDESLLGGSAPADFTFYAYTTDAVIHNEWQIAEDPEFEYIKYRFNEQDLSHTFNEEGKYYVRFVGSNYDGSCEEIGDTYEIGIGASELRIPNVFSPDGDGVNDIWKVAYRSLVEFRCWIFDRNGRQLCYFDNPEHGWDGKHKGKVVNPGVYYYVIEAKGADGIKYKRGGDINIIRYKKIGSSTGSYTE